MAHTYQEQLCYVFDRPTSEPAWFWNIHDERPYPFDDKNSAFLFLESLCKAPGKQLESFSDDQLGLGLNFIFSSSCSDLSHNFSAAEVGADRMLAAIESLFTLFAELLNVRCTPQTRAGSQESLSKLDYICYMFWDVTSLVIRSENCPLDQQTYQRALASLMEKCLYLDNPACVESGLHGLGHMVMDFPGLSQPIIDKYLKAKKLNSPRQIAYAKAARTGGLQ